MRRVLSNLLRFLFGAALLWSGAGAVLAEADNPVKWRNDVAALRMLSEYDVLNAYQAAKSLLAAQPADASPVDRIRMLNALSRVEIYAAETGAAAEHARQAYELAIRAGDKAGQAEADVNIARNAVNHGDIESLTISAPRALEALAGIDRPEVLVEAMLFMGQTYRRFDQIDESITMAMRAMEIAKQTGNPLALAYAEFTMASSYALSGRKSEAYEHYEQMRTYAQVAGSRLLEVNALLGIAESRSYEDNLKGPEADLRLALNVARRSGAPFTTAMSLSSLAHNLYRQDRLAEALSYYNEAAAICEKYANRILYWWMLSGRGRVLQAMQRLDAATADAEKGAELAAAVGLPQLRSDSASRLAELADLRGDDRKAYEYMRQSVDIAGKAKRDANSQRMLELAQRFQNESKQREIDELTRREHQRELERRWLWTVLVGSIVLLVVAGQLLLRLRRAHRLIAASNEHLRRSQEEIRALNVELEQRVQSRTDQLRQQTRYLRTLVDTLPDCVWLKDTEGRYLVVNGATPVNIASSGLSPQEMVGKTDMEVWSEPVARALRESDVEIMTTRKAKTDEVELPDENGRPFWREIEKAPVIDDDGTVLGTVGVARDISERKAVEAAREAALAAALKLAKMRSDFLAHLSHELRTPLNGILGYAEILLQDKALGERQTAALGIIEQSGKHLLSMIDDILDLARIETGKFELAPDDVSLLTFLHVVSGIVAIKAQKNDIAFVEDFAADLPAVVSVDEKRLRQILLNLLSNAVKFTERGHVALRVMRAGHGRIAFAIEDTGVGIAPQDMASIFEPFERPGEVQRRVSGTGLGLAISRQLARQMGGDIEVESRLGAGSTFRFTVPMPEVDSVPVSTQAPEASEAAVVARTEEREAVLVVPPLDELEVLHRLAQLGNMRDIQRQAQRIVALDDRYGPFAARLQLLAESCRSKAILSFVEGYLNVTAD